MAAENTLDQQKTRNRRAVKPLRWPLSILHLVLFITILVIFQPLLMFSRFLISIRSFDFMLALMNWCLIQNMRIGASSISVEIEDIPKDRPTLLILNHQSMYDIPFIMWHLRSLRPRFVAKVELKRFIPSISFSLRHGEHLLIDRSDPVAASELIRQYTKVALKNDFSICIFPEGTRARDGKMKPFKLSGARIVLEEIPEITILPVCLDGTARFVRHGLLPIPGNTHLRVKTLAPRTLEAGQSSQNLLLEVEQSMRKVLEAWQKSAAPLDEVTQQN